MIKNQLSFFSAYEYTANKYEHLLNISWYVQIIPNRTNKLILVLGLVAAYHVNWLFKNTVVYDYSHIDK